MVKFGTILKPVGLKGEVRVFSDSDFVLERLKKGKTFIANHQTLTVLKSRSDGNLHTVKFKEINSIDEAEKFRQFDLLIDELDASLLNENEYYFVQLVGCQVYQNQQLIGSVVAVEEGQTHENLRIERHHKTFLLPFVKAFIKNVDINRKRIDVQLIEGFYED